MMKIDCPKLVKSSILVAIFFLVFFPNAAFALSSDTINFQGKIVRNDTGYEGLNVTTGSPACVVAGNGNDTCDFEIKYYSAASGGTLLLTEDYQNTEIGQYNGAFNLSLGSDGSPTAGSYATFDAMIKGVTDLYVQLGFSPAGNATYSETFSRMPIQASAYAIKAKYASGANTAFQFDSAANSSGYTSPVAGMVYYDTTDAALKVYNGSTWGGLGSGTGSLFTDGGIFTYLTALTDHFVLGSSSYTAIGADSYTTYLSGLSTRPSLSFDMDAERLTISGSQVQSGLTVYSSYASAGGWPVATFKAEDTSFDNVVMQITQDGTGNILSLQKGSTEAFAFENPLTFYIHPRVDDPLVTANRLYNVNGTLYWNGSPVGGGSGSLWTDTGTFTYLTATTSDVVIGGNTLGTAAFFFDVSTGNFGIGTSTPGAKLDIAGSNSTISNTTGDITLTSDEAVVIKANDTAGDNLMEWQDSTGAILSLINQNGYATFGGNTGNTGAMLSLGASTGTVAQINLAAGLDVAAPSTGDMWWNGTSLYFYDGSTSVDLLTAGGGGSNVLSNYGTVSNGTYIGVTHDTNSYDVVASGWICVGGSNNAACSGGQWKNVQETDFTITHSLSNQWQDADTDGIIRSIIKLTDVELAPGIDVGTGVDGNITITSNVSIDATNSISGRSCADGGDAVSYNISAFNAGGTTATLTSSPSTGCINIGDEVLLINLQGITTAYGNTGNYETLRVSNVTGSTITFYTAKSKYYGNNLGDDTNLGVTTSTQRVIMQRVPNYNNVTINSGYTFSTTAWNGTKGGVLFFRAKGTVSVGGTISAYQKGYRNGATVGGVNNYMGSGGGEAFCSPGGAAGGSGAGGAGAGGGGSGYANYTAGTAYCGGGGAGSVNTAGSASAGGAGGGASGHAAGGAAGYGTAGTGGASSGVTGGTNTSGAGGPAASGGGGGGGTYGDANLNKLMLGSGGASGGAYTSGATGGRGGIGGGIISIAVNSLSVSGSINSNGEGGSNYVSCDGTYPWWGGGGGASGGSIKVAANTGVLGAGLVTANGGTGSSGCASGGVSYYGGNGGVGRIAIYYATALTGSTSPTYTGTSVGYNNYGIYNSPVISTPNAQSYDNLRWDASLNTYGKISVQTRSGNTPDPTAPANSFIWTKYDNTIPDASDTTGTNGRIPTGTSGTGDEMDIYDSSVIKDGDVYKMWYIGRDADYSRIYYATSQDGINWTKYDNSIPAASDTTSTNGRIPLGTSGKGDEGGVTSLTAIKDNGIYKIWYTGEDINEDYSIVYYATSPDGLTWTKYDNTIPVASDTTSTNGRLPLGTDGKGDESYIQEASVIKDGSVYKMWYAANFDFANYGTYGSNVYYATSPDGLVWTKYNNTIPANSNTTSTNGRIPRGTYGKGDDAYIWGISVLKDENSYKAWYVGYANADVTDLYYATSSDGLVWGKYDNTIPTSSDKVGTNGRLAVGTSGSGDVNGIYSPSVLKDGDTFKIWYNGPNSSWQSNTYYATGVETIGSWEEWKPYDSGTNQTIIQNADTHTTFTGTNATVAEGDITRNVDYFEDEDEPLGTNLTKVTSSTNGGYMESTIAATNIVNYDYLTLWVRASQAGNVLRIGIGETAATEQYEDITIDVANVWQKVYWDLSDISATSRDAITKIRLTNFSTSSNVIYLDNVRAEKLLAVNTGSPIASTPNQYLQYRVIFTTTNLSYQPQLESISLAYNSGYRIVMYDANNVRLYNYSGGNEYLRLEVVASTGAGSSGGGFVNGLAVSHVADGEDAIAFQFNTSTAFTNPSSKLLSVMNNSVEKMYLDADGNLYVSGTITSGKGLGAVLINNSGGIVTERSLVTVDSSTNGAFTTTTVPGLQGALGVVQGVELNGDVDKDGVCDNGDACLVAFEGVVDVNLDNAASSSRGDYIYSSTVAGQGHSSSGTTQTNGLLGVVTSIADAGSGYVKMVFDAQNKVTADMYLNVSYDENVYRDIYNQLANDYTAMSDAERRGYLESNQSQTVMFDNFVDSLKIDSTNSTIGVDSDAKKAGVWGGITIDSSMLDIAGNRYLGSATATLLTSKYYDRTQSGLQDQDSTPETLVDVGVDPNWYKGVSLQTTSNLTTSYNGSLIGVSGVYGTGSEHGYIDLTITGTTTTGITANIVSSDGTCTASGANLAFGSSYAFVSGSCSGSSITVKPVRSDYKNGDKFRIASWIIEPTTANDRGSKREFPERSVIIGSTDASYIYVTIVDVDTQRVWMKFASNNAAYAGGKMLSANTGRTINAMDVLNGQLYVVSNTSAADNGYQEISFVNDSAIDISNGGTYRFSGSTGIGGRDIGSGYTLVNTSVSIISNEVNDVSAAVIPNQPTQEMTVSGWGYIQGDNSQDIAEFVNFPYKFDNTPIVTMSHVGRRATSSGVPSSQADCVDWFFEASSAQPRVGRTNTNFEADMGSANATYLYSSSYNYCYTWTATGTVSPKQFVAVATGDTGVDGAVTVINKTQGTKADVWNGTQHANVLWTSKAVLTSNNVLYIAGNDDTGNNSALYSYYNPASISSDATWTVQNNGYYFQGASAWKLAILGVTSVNQIKNLRVTEGTSIVDGKSNTLYVGTAAGVSVIQEVQGKGNLADGSVEATGSVKYYTKDYISEQMVGDIRGMWPLNYDNTSADNEDVSTKANALTAVNIDSNDAVSGVRGKAVDFNGTDEYLYCTDATCGGVTKTDITGNVTVSAWINPANVAGTKQILGKGDGGTAPYYTYQFYTSGQNLAFTTYNGTSYTVTATGAIPTANTWYNVVGSYDGSVMRLYVNGVEVASQTGVPAAAFIDNTERFTIGSRISLGTPSVYFAGIIDEPMVTGTVLTSAQIKSQYEDGLRALKGSHTSADTYNQLSGTSNDIRDILVTPDSKYMYVGTEGGGISKIDLTSSTRLNAYTTATDPSTSTNNIETLSGRYYPVFAGDIGSSGALMGVDSNGNNSTGTYYSNVTTFAESTNRAFLWMTASIDGSDPSSSITVSASNDNGANYVTGTLIQTNTLGSLPEYEYSFIFPTSDKNYKVKFEIARGSSNKTAIYISKWGLSQMELDDASVNGLFTNSNDVIANGSYLEVVHGQNTYNLVANGWVFDTTLNKWVEVTGADNNVTQNLSNQWSDAAAGGVIRTSINASNLNPAVIGIGGTITYTDTNGLNPRTTMPYPGGYTVHTFTSSGTFTPTTTANVEVLVVAGGGGGKAGGGGAGGLLYNASYAATTASPITVTVGAGGAGGASPTQGGNSVFGSLTAIGGGRGGTNDTTGPEAAQNGGSGGGGGRTSTVNPANGGTGTAGQGYAGGNTNVIAAPYPSSGGGGAAGGGYLPASTTHSGAGGAGSAYSISGISTYYAGGGGGGADTTGSGGAGGVGGGGDGGMYVGYPGTANTGGGGGGSNGYGGAGAGGSGVVIVRYRNQTPYGIYNSPVVSTTNAQSYDNLKWDASLNTYGKISVQTRSGATNDPTDGTWESWKPSTSGTNYTTLQGADTHTDWTGTNATVAEGDITRPSIYGFEDEVEPLGTNLTKVTSSTNGGYMESTIAAANLTNYDYVTLWVRASQAGNTIRIGMGESTGADQYEDITIDTANVWQKIYWDISDIAVGSRDAITKIRLTNFSTSSNTIYLDNVEAEKLLSTNTGSPVASTPNAYMQYRVIFTTTNLSYQPQLENITFTYSSGFKIQITDANTVRLYNNSGKAQKLKLDVILGSAAIDLRTSEYSVNIAPNAAQIDGGNNTNSIWVNKMGTGGNLLKLQTNSVDMMVVSSEGDMTLAGDVAIAGGSITLGTTGDQGSIRYNATDNTIEFSNDGIEWMPLGDIARKVTLSAEYAGAVLSGDGTDNVGAMTSDNTGSSSNSMNYYEWSSAALSLNDYDLRVRFTLPSDFNGWGSTGGVKLNYTTESTSDTNNKVDMYIYKEDSVTVDGTFAAGVSSSAGVWTSSTIAGTDLNECAVAGDTCVFIMRMSSLSDNYVRIGDIAITYNRSL